MSVFLFYCFVRPWKIHGSIFWSLVLHTYPHYYTIRKQEIVGSFKQIFEGYTWQQIDGKHSLTSCTWITKSKEDDCCYVQGLEGTRVENMIENAELKESNGIISNRTDKARYVWEEDVTKLRNGIHYLLQRKNKEKVNVKIWLDQIPYPWFSGLWFRKWQYLQQVCGLQ